METRPISTQRWLVRNKFTDTDSNKAKWCRDKEVASVRAGAGDGDDSRGGGSNNPFYRLNGFNLPLCFTDCCSWITLFMWWGTKSHSLEMLETAFRKCEVLLNTDQQRRYMLLLAWIIPALPWACLAEVSCPDGAEHPSASHYLVNIS